MRSMAGTSERSISRVHGLDDGLRLGAAADVGLVGGDDEDEAGGFSLRAGFFGHAGKELELGERGGRVGFALADDLHV